MKKKVISIILALVVCISVFVPNTVVNASPGSSGGGDINYITKNKTTVKVEIDPRMTNWFEDKDSNQFMLHIPDKEVYPDGSELCKDNDLYVIYQKSLGASSPKYTKTNTLDEKEFKLYDGVEYKDCNWIAHISKNSNGNYVVTMTKANPKKTTISVAKSSKKKNMTVKVKSQKYVAGYEISVSTDKKFKKNVKTVTTTKPTYTFKKLKSGKTYYVRVRTFKTVGKVHKRTLETFEGVEEYKYTPTKKDECVYSAYSKVKTVKVK